jgi:two-component system osmolarity sensor histidine kinase EnvZ
LRRIIINLVENAVRYGDGKEIEVRQSSDGDLHDTIIEIRDRGPGIPERELNAVFQPFYRLEHSRSSKTGGSGLGLSIVRQLAHTNGWRVELVSRRGGGMVARVHIPGGSGEGENIDFR